MLYLVGQKDSKKSGPNRIISASKANYDLDKQSLTRIHRGIYCDEEDADPRVLPDFMRRNAIRIANYLLGDSALSHSSAHYKGAIEEQGQNSHFKLFLAGNYKYKIELPHLEIIQSEALKEGQTNQYLQVFKDNQDRAFGAMSIKCFAEELVYLQQFGKRRYNPERFIADDHLEDLRANLLERHGRDFSNMLRKISHEIHGGPGELADALKHATRTPIARAQMAQRFINDSHIKNDSSDVTIAAKKPAQKKDAMNNLSEFSVGWYQREIGTLTNNGVNWNFNYNDGWLFPITLGKIMPGIVPCFISNLMPEGYMMDAMGQYHTGEDGRIDVFGKSERYMSNITIVSEVDRHKQLVVDRLTAKLADFVDEDRIFNGFLSSMPKFNDKTMDELNLKLVQIGMPRQSGNQPKIPCYLDEQGVLTPADGQPFTHILKLPGVYGDNNHLKGVGEWASMTLLQASGTKTCDFGLVKTASNSLAYVCERFDIPQNEDDMRMIFAEDFCSATTRGPNNKMPRGVDIPDIINIYKNNATPNVADAEQLFRQIYGSYILENGDLHLKNLAFMRVAEPNLENMRSTRLTPAYDVMNTWFYHAAKPGETRESMIFKINGKENETTREDFQEAAILLGISPERSLKIMSEMTHKIAYKAAELHENMPEILACHPIGQEMAYEIMERATKFCNAHFPDIALLSVRTDEDIDVNPAINNKLIGFGQDDEDPDDDDVMTQIRNTFGRPT